ncbi:hydroxymethylglutaryl-CoA lyase [Fusobacterium sp. PH5-44]|uniref:hydroxymethylglutaryl-CoA lyase n=1 Tax=unclassified Fusobacterium TaxID=2648384 RepID=UPI003D1F88F2
MEINYDKNIELCEVGLRDGLQNEKKILTTNNKVDLIHDIVAAGFKVIEIGSFVSPKAVPQMANTDEVYKAIKMVDGIEYRALIGNLKGVERAIQCGCKKVKLNVSASKSHNLANLNMTPEESVYGFKACVDEAIKNKIEISGSISMAFGSPWDKEIPMTDIKNIVESYLNLGINEISLSDASGMAYPSQVYNICKIMKKEYPNVKWWLHFHNTRGLGIANILAGIVSGFSRFDTSFAGAGGCPFVPGAAGNVSTEDVVHMLNEMGIKTNLDIDKIISIGKKVIKLMEHDGNSYIIKAGKSKELIKELPTGQIKNQVK